MATKTQSRNKKRNQAVVSLLLMALILICINILPSFFIPASI